MAYSSSLDAQAAAIPTRPASPTLTRSAGAVSLCPFPRLVWCSTAAAYRCPSFWLAAGLLSPSDVAGGITQGGAQLGHRVGQTGGKCSQGDSGVLRTRADDDSVLKTLQKMVSSWCCAPQLPCQFGGCCARGEQCCATTPHLNPPPQPGRRIVKTDGQMTADPGETSRPYLGISGNDRTG
jgi:hypothetical protein